MILAVLVVVGFVILCGIVLLKHPSNDALKLIGGIGAVFGTILGAVSGYFFTRPAIDEAHKRVAAAEVRLTEARTKLAELNDTVVQATSARRVAEDRLAVSERALKAARFSGPVQARATRREWGLQLMPGAGVETVAPAIENSVTTPVPPTPGATPPSVQNPK